MHIVIPVELALYGFLRGSLALAWYTSTWRTRLGWTYAIIGLITAMVIVIRLLWQVYHACTAHRSPHPLPLLSPATSGPAGSRCRTLVGPASSYWGRTGEPVLGQYHG